MNLRTQSSSLLPLTLFLSLVAHIWALTCVVLVPTLPNESEPQLSGEPIEVFDKDLVADIDLEPGPAQSIVNSEKAHNKTQPTKTPYLGKQDQTVEKDEKAKYGDSFRAEEKAGTQGGPKTKNAVKALSMADLALDSQPRGRWTLGDSSDYEGSVTSDSASNDYLPQVSPGVRTLLNTREYRFFSYIERIRQAVASEWQTDVQRRIDALWVMGRAVNAGQDLVTKLAITLNERGEVKEVSVIRSSGSRTIDHAGESVFHRVAVFPNPPKGIADDKGLITLRWVFVLKVTPHIANVDWEENSSDASKERYIR